MLADDVDFRLSWRLCLIARVNCLDRTRLLGGSSRGIGPTGFIARWVARALSRQGAQVVSVVRNREAMKAIASRYGIRNEIAQVDPADNAAVSALIEGLRPSITFDSRG